MQAITPRAASVWSLAAAAAMTIAVGNAQAAQPIAHEVAALYNVLKNPGFEDGGARPASWGRYPRQDSEAGRLMRDTGVAHSGKASGLVWSAAPYVPGKPWMQWNQYGLPVEGGCSLIVSCHVKTEGCAPAHVGFHFYGEGRAHLGFVPLEFRNGKQEWTYLRGRVDVPDAAQTMGFVLYARDKGKTWYDDVAVLATPSASAARGTPKLDGRLDDACWAKNLAVSRFAVHTGDRLPADGTRAWIAYDDRALYVAFRCPHPAGSALKADAQEHDGKSWLDDSIEVFLDPDHDHKGYYQFTVNSLGVIRDSRGTDPSWESGARAAVVRRADAWLIELAIPYDNLALTLDVGQVWGINLVRNDRVRGETSTWSLGGFHRASRFGNVALAPDLSRYCRNDLGRRLDQREQDMAGLRQELRAAEFAEDDMREPARLLSKAKAEIARLRRVAAGDVVSDKGGWAGVKRALAGVADTTKAARAAALQAVFAVQDKGEGAFRIAIAHSLQKVRRSGPVLEGMITQRVRLDAARDETESFQLVVIPSGRSLKQVEVAAPPLKAEAGQIPIEWQRVDYVETAPPGYPTKYVGWWPDPLLPPGPFDVAAGQRQPLWFNVVVPPDARPGDYRGEVTIRHAGQSIAVPVTLRVRSFRLPRPGTLATAFGLYAQILSDGYYRGPYRERMAQKDYVRWCEFMARYRLTPKNVARDYISFERKGDEWTFDLSGLKPTVADLAPKYYAPYSFCLHRLPTGPTVLKGIESNNAPNITHWAAIVKAIDAEWRRRGLPPKVYIYGVDEPRREIYPFLREAYAKIRETAPQYPIMQTIGDASPTELVGAVDIWCPLSARLDSPFYAERVKAGDTLWTYVCCSPKHPYANFFVDRPATEHRVLFWQTWQRKATGFLYWCVCYWRGLPTPSTGKKCWPEVPLRFGDLGTYRSYKDNGDGVLIYPGPDMTPYSSLRLEIIRDGIEDYEYLALLARLVNAAKALPAAKRPAQELLDKAEALCLVPASISRSMSKYTDRPESIFERRRQVADMAERLWAAAGVESGRDL